MAISATSSWCGAKWLDERAYADLVALSQFLPGPASSQTGFAIGLTRAGTLGGLAAWAGFTLPSAAAMTLFAYGEGALMGKAGDGLLHGLKLIAVAIVAQAVMGMARSLAPDRPRATIAVLSLMGMAFAPAAWAQIAVIVFGALAGIVVCRQSAEIAGPDADAPISRRMGIVFAGLFFALLALSFVPAGSGAAALAAAFYRSGALVFGGGHVVLPLLRAAVVDPGWVSDGAFLAGYGAAQAVPGPLFTFAAYLGAAPRQCAARRLGRGGARARCDLRAGTFAADGGHALLAWLARSAGRPRGDGGRQRGRGRPARLGAVQSRLDERG